MSPLQSVQPIHICAFYQLIVEGGYWLWICIHGHIWESVKMSFPWKLHIFKLSYLPLNSETSHKTTCSVPNIPSKETGTPEGDDFQRHFQK